MAFNVSGGVEVPLNTFGSLVTETVPEQLPEGVSPDNQDVVYAPGQVGSRPGLHKVLETPLAAGGPNNLVPTLTNGGSFVDPTGTLRNVYFDSNGMIWVETTLGTLVAVSTPSTPGCWMKSITAFGRQYIAISDGLHGQEVPLQFDGTNWDRVTQDGPGAPPTVASVALPPVLLVGSGSASLTPYEVQPGAQNPDGSYSQILAFTSSAWPLAIGPGDSLTLAGYTGTNDSNYNGTFTVLATYQGSTNLLVLGAYLPAGTVYSAVTAGITWSAVTGSLVRSSNTVTATTAKAHQLQVGYEAQIAGVGAAAVGGGISSIVIDNEDLPGLATVTTASKHGLVPGCQVILAGVQPVAVGGAITAASWAGGIAEITTTSAHGLTPGCQVTVAGTGAGGVNGTFSVLTVPSPTTFTYVFTPIATVTISLSGPTVTLVWPIPDSSAPTYFEVVATPTPTSFQVEVTYSDGTWTTGTVSFSWNGTFFVASVPSATSFTYQQYGPNATSSSTTGTVTPYGQAAPGVHQCQVHFLTRQGYITRPSPPVQFVANGGQYVSVSNIPIGPPNVVARVLAFTGAQGAYFFYIPVPAQVNGQQVSTATQINDNTTTAVLLDFSDVTLYSSLGVSIPGNNLAGQIILDGALGFGFYGSRLLAYGQRNKIQNLLNMGFEGGALPTSSTAPTGWTLAGTAVLAAGHFGEGLSISPSSSISQSVYLDAYQGAPILQPNTAYKFRAWLKPSTAGLTVTVTVSSILGTFSSSISFSTGMSTSGSWLEATFATKTPSAIPSDMLLTIAVAGSAGTVLVDECSLIYADSPYADQMIFASYIDNPEAFDGVSGKFGPSEDVHKVMDFAIVRDNLYILTQDPAGRLHETSDNGTTEPSGWNVREIGANCGALSAFCTAHSQADDASAGGGEEWFAWASASGARIFGGDQPYKINQELAPDWANINPAAALTIWALNDPISRTLYFGLPMGSATAASLVHPMSYRQLDSPAQIAASPPIHVSYTGRLIATDNTRKWTRWNLPINGAALMYRAPGVLSVVFFGGNGQAPGAAAGFGNAYSLDPTKLTDDDYGQIVPYYTTYFFVGHDNERMLKLDSHRKMLAYLTAAIRGTGTLTITVFANSLTNPWAITGTRPLAATPNNDLGWAGGSATAERIAIKIASAPLPGQTDNGFLLTKLVPTLRPAARLPVRGAP